MIIKEVYATNIYLNIIYRAKKGRNRKIFRATIIKSISFNLF